MGRGSSPIPTEVRRRSDDWPMLLAFGGLCLYAVVQFVIEYHILLLRLLIWLIILVSLPMWHFGCSYVARVALRKNPGLGKTSTKVRLVCSCAGGIVLGGLTVYLLTRLLLGLVDPYATILHGKLKLVPAQTIVASLTEMQQARDEDFRKYAAKGWVDVGNASRETEAALIKLLEDPSSSVEIATAKEMSRLAVLSSALISHLVEKVVDKSPAMREQAIATLNTRIPDWHRHSSVKSIFPKLVVMTYVEKDHDLEQVMTKIDTRWRNGVEGEEVSQALAPIISSEFLPKGKRIRAMMVGEKIGPRAHHLIPALRAALDEESGEVRLQAIKTLGALGAIAQPALPDLHRIATSGREDALEALRVIDLITAAIPAEAHPH